MKQVCVNRATCSMTRSTTSSALLPTEVTAIPEPKSISELPSTSMITPPPAAVTNTGRTWLSPRATMCCRRSSSSRDAGPGISVTMRRSWASPGPPAAGLPVTGPVVVMKLTIGHEQPGRHRRAAPDVAGSGTMSPAKGSSVTQDHDSDATLASYAASRRFMLGRPRDLTLVPDDGRLVFLRAVAADDPATALWSLDLRGGQERLLADPRALLGGADEDIPAAELRRRERLRESARGIVAYSADTAGRTAVFALSGQLFACDLTAGTTRPVPTAGTCVDPQIDPAGTAVGYLHGRALRVVTLDGDVLTELSDADPEVSYGAAEFAAAEELSRHHGFWWSPDGRQLLVARVDTRDVTSCWLSDPTYNEQ